MINAELLLMKMYQNLVSLYHRIYWLVVRFIIVMWYMLMALAFVLLTIVSIVGYVMLWMYSFTLKQKSEHSESGT